LNWKNPANTDVAYQETAAGGYSVLFNESEPEVSPVAITIPATVSPNAIAINNPAKNYSFSGSAINCSGNITKDGAGTAAFGNTVTAGGSTSINAGRVEFTGTGTLTNGPLAIASGAYLSYNSASNFTHAATASTGMTLTGAGTIEKKGAGTVTFANGTGPVNWNLSPGALIDVQAGKLVGGSNNNDIWTNNKASLNIAAGATFDSIEANVTVNALTGGGIYQCGFFGPRDLKVGVNNGSGTFSGTLQTNGSGGVSSSGPILSKLGTGTQTRVRPRGAAISTRVVTSKVRQAPVCGANWRSGVSALCAKVYRGRLANAEAAAARSNWRRAGCAAPMGTVVI
jgi:hypothetical protein